jgi:hypothetical protein
METIDILEKFGLSFCFNCGILFHYETLKKEQFRSNLITQEYYCPCCKYKLNFASKREG